MSGEGESGEADKDAPEDQRGILGNLPRTRPSVRSPRRGDAPPATSDSGPEAASAKESADSGEPQAGERPAGSEIEQLAKAGLTLAGGVASIGLKVAGRAASTLRETIERS